MTSNTLQNEIIPSDIAILDILRKQPSITVAGLAKCLDVTANAVRQRLNRLMGQGYIERLAVKAERGRPSHQYSLTDKGRLKAGANFADLAMALWQEIRAIKDTDVQRGLLQRVSRRMGAEYADRVQGDTAGERMESLAGLFEEKRIPFAVEFVAKDDGSGELLPVLQALACPYPELAEQDRSVCSMERMMFSELIGEDVKLSNCRLNGEGCCTFELSGRKS